MLNQTEGLTFIKSLLEDASVYKYEDIMKTETDQDGVETSTVDTTATEQLEADLIIMSYEVYLSDMNDVLDTDTYNIIQAKEYTAYSDDEKKLFMAECYLIASLFLKRYALKYETEMFKTQLDMMNKVTQYDKSGKFFTADKYYKTALSLLAKVTQNSEVYAKTKQIYIRRY